MKILLVPSSYVPSKGGVELNTHELAKSLKKMGQEVIVITSNWREFKLSSHETIDGIEVFRLPFYIFRGSIKSLIAFMICFPVAFAGTFRLVKKLRPDVINVHFVGSNALYILIAHLITKIPIVVTFHGNEVTTVPDPISLGYTQIELKLMLWITNWLLRHARHITTVSNDLIRFAKKSSQNISAPVTAILLAGTIENSSSTSPGIGRPYILTVGRLATQKGIDLLIEAFVPIAQKNSLISLVIVGDGPEKPAIEKQVSVLNLVDRVRLIGALPKEEIVPYYENCLFVAMPSRWEGLGTVILEAFSFQKPVVATSVGGIPEMVIDGRTGILVNPENVEQLTDAIARLINDSKLREELGANAKDFVLKMGGWDRVAEQYMEVYRMSLAGSKLVAN